MKLTKEQKEQIKNSRNYHQKMHAELVDKILSNYLNQSQVEMYCADSESVTLKVLRLEKEKQQKQDRLRYKELVDNQNHYNELLYTQKARKALLEEELERINALPADNEKQRKSKVIKRNRKLFEIELQAKIITKIVEALNDAKKTTKKKKGRPTNEEKANPSLAEDETIEEELEDEVNNE